MADITNMIALGLSQSGIPMVSHMASMWQWVNTNPQASRVMNSAVASGLVPSSLINPSTLLVGFLTVTGKVLAKFITYAAFLLLGYLGYRLSKPMMQNMMTKLNGYGVETLFGFVKQIAKAMVSTTRRLLSQFPTVPGAEALRKQFGLFAARAKNFVGQRTQTYESVRKTPRGGQDVTLAEVTLEPGHVEFEEAEALFPESNATPKARRSQSARQRKQSARQSARQSAKRRKASSARQHQTARQSGRRFTTPASADLFVVD